VLVRLGEPYGRVSRGVRGMVRGCVVQAGRERTGESASGDNGRGAVTDSGAPRLKLILTRVLLVDFPQILLTSNSLPVDWGPVSVGLPDSS
jgi:hypothetical protein